MDSWLLPRTAGGPETAAPSTPAHSDTQTNQGKIQKGHPYICQGGKSETYQSTKKI